MEYTTEEIKKLTNLLKRYARNNHIWALFHENLLEATTNEELIRLSKDVEWARNSFNNYTTLYILIYEIPYENVPTILVKAEQDELTNLIAQWRFEIGK